MQAHRSFAIGSLFYPSLEQLSPFYLKFHNISLLLPSVACFIILSICIVQFSRCQLPALRPDQSAQLPLNTLIRSHGGGNRTRTGDPLLAKQVLYQLSYTPVKKVVGPSGLEPPTSRLSVVRSSQLSYGPVRTPSKLNNVRAPSPSKV